MTLRLLLIFFLIIDRIVVRPTDKEGAVVLQNFVDYENEIKRQLSDLTFYEKLSSDPTNRLKIWVYSQREHHFNNGKFDKNAFEFLKVEHPVMPFYEIRSGYPPFLYT